MEGSRIVDGTFVPVAPGWVVKIQNGAQVYTHVIVGWTVYRSADGPSADPVICAGGRVATLGSCYGYTTPFEIVPGLGA